MRQTETTFISGQIVEDHVEFTLLELCRVSGASEQELKLWVAEGVLDAHGEAPHAWRFSGAALRRARTARRLTRDLEVNLPGVALALELLDEIAALRAQAAKR